LGSRVLGTAAIDKNADLVEHCLGGYAAVHHCLHGELDPPD
jgi:hypothetical protein